MQLRDAGEYGVGPVGRGLEQGGRLRRALDRAFPAVDAAAGRKDIDARRKAFFDQGAADRLGFGGVGEDRVDGDDAHAARRPTVCIPQTVAPTSSAPTA